MFGEKEKISIYLGGDHAAVDAKKLLNDFLDQEGYKTTDLGTFSEDSIDYPDISREVGEKVVENKNSFGILLCGSGVGVCMAANKIRGIRAALANNLELAEMSRKHNNANVLTMGARMTSQEDIQAIALKFLTTEFDKGHERHVRRVKKLTEM
jgi:ribose 5-phosphate isomerase B